VFYCHKISKGQCFGDLIERSEIFKVKTDGKLKKIIDPKPETISAITLSPLDVLTSEEKGRKTTSLAIE
jgi:hypothetical protein